jgi:dipeptidyl aminopeptidase/acylaminoacyl peptidase
MQPRRRRWNAALVLIAGLIGMPASHAQTVPVEAFYRGPDIVQASLSPSGRRLAISTSAGGPRVALAVIDLDDDRKLSMAARFTDADVDRFYWVADDRLVLRIVDLTLGGGDQTFGPGLFSVKHDGSELRELIAPRRPFVGGRRIDREPLDWRHALLAVPAAAGNEVIVGRYMLDRNDDVEKVIPLRLDVTTLRTRPIVDKAPDDARQWLFDARGEALVAIATKEGRTKVHRREPGSERWQQLADDPWLEARFTPRFVDASGALYVTTHDGPAGYSVLKRFDFASGQPEPKALVSTPGFDFRGHLVESDAPGGNTLGVRTVTDAETTVWFDARMKKAQAAADARLPGRVNRLSCRRCESDEMVVLVQSWSDQEPGHVWVYRPASDNWYDVGRVRSAVDPRRMGTLDLHRIKARDGLDLPVWVTMPAGADPKKPHPAVVLVHGGPWLRGVTWGWDEDAQFLASRGYVVIEPEFRGSEGYGERHARAGWRQWGLTMQDDVADALQWAVSRGLVDGRRVCIAGASYGGYATLMGLIKHPELYRCGVAWVAVTDPRLLFANSWRNDISAEARRYGLPTLVGDPAADAAALAAVTPVELASRIKAPLMLAFGGEDRRVPIEHGQRMRAALRDAGQEPEWVLYPGEAHGWLKAETRYDFARRLETFLARHLK